MALPEPNGGRDDQAVADTVARLLGIGVSGVRHMAGGGNNKLYRVDGAADESFVAKHYFRQPSDTRDRLQVEYGGLEFLCLCFDHL